MYLTSAEYTTITGEAAPADFTVCLPLAEMLFDLHTLDFYAQETLSTLPAVVLARIKKCVAFQVQAISQAGGIAGMTEPQVQSASVGKVSYTMAAQKSLCAPAAMCIPYLLSYARGVEA